VDAKDYGSPGPPIPDAELRQLARSMFSVFSVMHELIADQGEQPFLHTLQDHLCTDPRALSVVTHQFPPYQLVDVQISIESWQENRTDRALRLVGISGEQRRFHPLSEIMAGAGTYGVGIGPVEYVDVADSPDSTRRCVRFGLFLLSEGDRRAAVLLRGADPHRPMQSAMLELVGQDSEFIAELLSELKQLAIQKSVLRQSVLALGQGEGNQYGALRFLHRPNLDRSELVLPGETLEQIERHVIGIRTYGDRLRAAGQHLKRGILLYGPPGTGKTHTVRYLLSQFREVTAFVLSGQSLGLIGMACSLARLLQPSLVVLEDVDLIAADRSFATLGSNPLLFEVLNQIDGLGDDVDVAFLLTTNRVDILERALAERPGRVDAAVEIGLPDDEGRSALFHLYGRSLGVPALTSDHLAEAIQLTDGRTATYIREVVRRAALDSAERQVGALRVDGQLLAEAARQLLGDRDALTRSLLGTPLEPDAEPPTGTVPPSAFGVSLARGMRTHPMMHGQAPPQPFGPE
jgi:cell division protease FtsH